MVERRDRIAPAGDRDRPSVPRQRPRRPRRRACPSFPPPPTNPTNQPDHVARADKTAPLPEPEKGAALEGMNAAGGSNSGSDSTKP